MNIEKGVEFIESLNILYACKLEACVLASADSILWSESLTLHFKGQQTMLH